VDVPRIYQVKKGSKFTVTYNGGSEPLQAVAMPPAAFYYTVDNKPNCYAIDPSIFRGPQGPAMFIQGTFKACDVQPYFNGTIQSGKPLKSKKVSRLPVKIGCYSSKPSDTVVNLYTGTLLLRQT
jgi:hypothetical protein